MSRIRFIIAGLILSLLQFASTDTKAVSGAGAEPITKTKLGEMLFHDKRLSADGTISCASCHDPQKAFSDGLPVAQGVGGQRGVRNTPSLLNVTLEKSLFWDGRRDTLEAQAGDPFINPTEHGFKDHTQVLQVILKDARYRQAFRRLFGKAPQAVTMQHVTMAIAEFERTLIDLDSPFDRYQAGDASALSPEAVRGMMLFKGPARCAACHVLEGNPAPLTDHQFHSLAIGFQKIEQRLAQITKQFYALQGKPMIIKGARLDLILL